MERDRELAEIRSVVEAALDGRGQFVIVEGAAGTGKSALIDAAADWAEAAEMRVLAARGSDLEREFAFGTVRRLFEPVLVRARARERAALLAGAARAAEWVLSDSPGGAPDRAAAGFTVLNAIHWLTVNLAARAPLMLLIDDLHWVDPPSLRSLNHLAGRITDVPAAMIVALRQEEPGAPAALLDEIRAIPGAARVVLRPLSEASVGEMVRRRIPAADEELGVACHEETGGNPLYLQELLRALPAGAAVTVGDVRAASLPSLGDRVARRVARVAPDAPALASAMAVLGDGGRLAHATGIAGLDDESAARIAHQLRRIELLSTEDPFNFVHPLVRRSIYDRLSVSERDAAHARAADALRDAGARPESIAAHIALIRPAGSVEAVEALRAAAQHALARAAPEAAIAWLRRALDEDAAEPPRWALLAELGYAEIAIRNPAAIEHLSEALRGADDARWRARIYTALTEILVTTGQWEAGRKRTDAAFAELGEHEDPDVALEVVAMWAIATMSDSRSVEEFDRRRTSLNAAAAGANWPARALSATLAMEAALRGDRVETVVPLVERALRDGRLLAERGAGAWASAQALGALVTIDENDRALAATRELAAAARECGSVIGTYTADGTRAFVHARRGELAAAEAEVRTGIEMMTQAGMAMMVTSAVLVICDAIVERPTLDDVATLMETTELEPRFLETWGGAMLLESRARVRLARRDRAGAIADLRACAPVIAALGYGPTASVWRSVLALALPADDREEALGLAREEVALAKATGLARPYGVALRAAGVLEGGPAGIDLLRESVSVLEQTEARLELARSVVDLGAALRRSHRKAEAREHLGRGTELALRCGAERLVERAQDELRAAGARRRRRDISGAASLTASEQRVAHLAAAGASNAEIAQDLYVTLKTVETHLSHVYMKLGLSGQGARSRLAQALDEPD